MTDDPQELEQRATRRGVRAAVAFGVLMATLEMGVLLALLYC